MPELSPTDTNSDDRKTLHIQSVTKLLNDLTDSTIAIFTDCNSLINPGLTGAGALIFRAGKLTKAVSSNSTNYHGETDAILLAVNIVSPPKIKGGGVLVFKIWTKRGVMKKLLRNMGVC